MRTISNVLASFLFVISLFSCSKENPLVLPNQNMVNSSISVRSDIKPDSNSFDITEEMAALFARSLKEKSEICGINTYCYQDIPCLYIVNYEKGWVVIPSDSRVQPILGESEIGNLDIDKVENPGVRVWLMDLAEAIVSIKESGIEDYNQEFANMWNVLRSLTQVNSQFPRQLRDTSSDEGWIRITNTTTSTSTDANVDHLLPTKWGQRFPWNISLPEDPNAQNVPDTRFPTGCVPTAVAQVLYYFHQQTGYPNDLWHDVSVSSMSGNDPYTLTLEKSNHVVNSPRWNYMPLIASTLSPYLDTDLFDSTAYGYVSDLMMDIGVRMGANYSMPGTGANLSFSWNLNPCGITCQAGSYNYNTVKSNLLNGKPVIITAESTSLGCSHAWVIDGCYDAIITTTVTSHYYHYHSGYSYPSNATYISESEMQALYPDAYDGMSVVESSTHDHIRYLLMNYGWNGEDDDAHYGIVGLDWSMGFNNSKRIFYNLSAGQLN